MYLHYVLHTVQLQQKYPVPSVFSWILPLIVVGIVHFEGSMRNIRVQKEWCIVLFDGYNNLRP